MQHDSEDLLDNLRDLSSPTYLQNDTAALHIRAMVLVARLKSLYRAANAATRVKKEETAAARQEMDQSHLNLQNLLYEKRHLEREIEKCRQFASIYQDIPLYNLDDFKSLAPEELRAEDILSDDHQLMLNRLNFELAERQRLDQKKKELLHRKTELLRQSKTHSSTMDSVNAQFDLLTKTASEAQKKVSELVQSIHPQVANSTPS
ncbi:Fms-interacting protein-domain-containing protein [Gymnopilus junonius]|uniref:Fms-interacting protein-domain-containing protein n=1 Tax=Gymnopilus junonius TaxID=109634 RepID=A0A9P5P310_GYMJU|nr:Fms-interacting protein-domain-containing protein [Gymnopilus junonius]